MALPHHIHMPVEEYFAIDERDPNIRYEYIDGHIRMLSGGTPDHAKIAANLIIAIGNQLSDSCSIDTSDARVRLSKTRYVHPDVVVSCDEHDGRQENAISHPLLIVEVLSPDSYYYDRHSKFKYYEACPDVQEYVLVSSQYLWVEVFRRRQAQDKSWFYSAYLHRGDEIAFTSLDLHVPIENVYRNVDIALAPGPPDES